MFEIGKSYNFETIAPVTLLYSYRNMKVVGRDMSFGLVIKFSDVYSTHNKILEETGLNLLDPKKVSYTIFETIDRDMVVMSSDWVVPSSVVLLNKLNANLKITDINQSDLVIIRDSLNALGYKFITLDIDSMC